MECTPYDVSECIENDEEINPKLYTTACDPRLNFRQTRKIIVFVNSLLKKLKKKEWEKINLYIYKYSFINN